MVNVGLAKIAGELAVLEESCGWPEAKVSPALLLSQRDHRLSAKGAYDVVTVGRGRARRSAVQASPCWLLQRGLESPAVRVKERVFALASGQCCRGVGSQPAGQPVGRQGDSGPLNHEQLARGGCL